MVEVDWPRNGLDTGNAAANVLRGLQSWTVALVPWCNLEIPRRLLIRWDRVVVYPEAQHCRGVGVVVVCDPRSRPGEDANPEEPMPPLCLSVYKHASKS